MFLFKLLNNKLDCQLLLEKFNLKTNNNNTLNKGSY